MATKRATIFSRREGKNKFLSVTLNGRTDDEVDELIREFKDRVREDNKKFDEEKSQNIQQEKQLVLTKEPQQPSVESIDINTALNMSFRVNSGNSIVILASSGAGKSNLLSKLINIIENKDPIIKIYMVGDISNPLYDSKNGVIFDHINGNMIYSCRSINTALNNKYNFWFILDDIEQIKNRAMKEDAVRGLMLSFRNQNLSGILSIQSEKLISVEVGNNSNILFFGHLNDHREILKTIRTKLASVNIFFETRGDDQKVLLYRKLVADFHFIVYMPLIDSSKIFTIKINI